MKSISVNKTIQMDFFEHNLLPILVINPTTGNFVAVNNAAIEYYGYSKDKFMQLKISDINILSQETLLEEMKLATDEKRNFFNFHHKLASGEIRQVEVVSTPLQIDDERLLCSTVTDTSQRQMFSDRLIHTNQSLKNDVELKRLALQKELAFNKTLLESMLDAVVVCDASGKLILFNEAARVWHGEDALGIDQSQWAETYNLYHGDSSKLIEVDENPLVKALNGDVVENIEMVLKPKHSISRYVSCSGKQILDQDGQVIGAMIVLKDITQQRIRERLLQISEIKYREIFENTPVGLFNFDVNGIITEVNQEFIETMGSSKELLRGFEAFHMNDVQMTRAIHHCLKGLKTHYEGWYTSVTGNKKSYITAIFTPQLDGDLVVGGVGVINDITRLKESEIELEHQKRTFEALFKESPLAIIQYDENHRTVRINDAFMYLFGYSRDEAVGQEVDSLISNYELRDEAIHYTKAIFEGEGVRCKGLRTHKSGRKIMTEIVGVPIILNDKVSGGFSLYADISEQDKMQLELIKAKEDAEKANYAKSQFLANMSHEIRTPMNGLLGMIQLLQRTQIDQEQIEYLRLANSSGEALLNLVSDIMDYTKIEADRVELERLPINLNILLKDVIALYLPLAMQKNIEISLLLSENLPVHIIGDSFRLKQILNNLIGNAVKFTDLGKIEIAVEKIAYSEASKHKIKFAVKDSGIGIPLIKADQLFNRFSQISPSTTRKYGGTGLGLAISKKLAVLMGGEIWFDSIENIGSNFYFTCVFDEIEKGSQQTVKTPSINMASSMNESRNILIVDDDYISRLLIEKIIGNQGWQTTLCENGYEAVEACKSKRYDIILMDCQMPVLDGYEASNLIKNSEGLNNETPIIALTAFAMVDDLQKCLDHGMDSYLSKPINYDLLLQEVNKYNARLN